MTETVLPVLRFVQYSDNNQTRVYFEDAPLPIAVLHPFEGVWTIEKTRELSEGESKVIDFWLHVYPVPPSRAHANLIAAPPELLAECVLALAKDPGNKTLQAAVDKAQGNIKDQN